MILLKNCRIVRELTEGFDDERADVAINDKYIVDIKSPGYISSLDYDDVFDLEGKTLIPGLFDLHTHLYSFIFNSYELQCMSMGEILFGAYEFAKEYLRWGYTTIRDCGSTHNCAVAVRDAIKKGYIEGPRIISSGLIITPTETGNDTFKDLYYEADGPNEIRKACRTELKKNNDFIKLMVTGAFMNKDGDPGKQIVTFEEMNAAVEIAKLKGTYVCGHCHGTEAIKEAIRAGIRTIEHGVFIDDEGIKLIKEKEDCFMVPTGAITLYCLDNANSEVSPELIEKTRYYAEKERSCVYNAYKSGLVLGFGSDLDLTAFKAQSGYEFIARKNFYGFKDLDILMQATKYSAEIAMLDDLLGTLKVGKYADLIVIDGKPDEDINVMKKPVVHIFKEGKKIIF